jgi:hypothetical protein
MKYLVKPGLEEQIERLRVKWKAAHFEQPKSGYYGDFHLIVIPGFHLPKGWNKTICTVLFLARVNDDKLSTPLDGFYVDLPDLRLNNGRQPKYARPFAMNDYYEYWHEPTKRFWSTKEEIPGFPQWRELTRFWWHQQSFNPNSETLFTSAMVIKRRLDYVQ